MAVPLNRMLMSSTKTSCSHVVIASDHVNRRDEGHIISNGHSCLYSCITQRAWVVAKMANLNQIKRNSY